MYSSTMEARTVVSPCGAQPAPRRATARQQLPRASAPAPAPSIESAAPAAPLHVAGDSTADSATHNGAEAAAWTVAEAQPTAGSHPPSGDAADDSDGGGCGGNEAPLPSRLSAEEAELPRQLGSMQVGGGGAARATFDEAAADSLPVAVGDLGGCLRMFGGAPSPYLRTAQGDFVEAVRAFARLAAARHELLAAVAVLK